MKIGMHTLSGIPFGDGANDKVPQSGPVHAESQTHVPAEQMPLREQSSSVATNDAVI